MALRPRGPRGRRDEPDLLEQLQQAQEAKRLDDEARAREERLLEQAGGPTGPSRSLSSARPPTERFKAGGLWLLALFGGVVTVAIVAERGKPAYPALATSCTTGAVAVVPTTVKPRDEVRYTLVGPDGDVLITLNTTAVSADGIATPSSPDAVTQVFPERPMVGCRQQRSFPAQVPVGDHVVRAFRLVDGVWTELASTPLTVR